MKRLFNTLAFRLTFWYTLVVVTLITVAFTVSYISLKNTLNQNMDYDLLEGIKEYRILYQTEGIEGVKREIDLETNAGESSNFFFEIIDINNHQIYSSEMSYWKFLPNNSKIIKEVFMTSQPVFHNINLPEEEGVVRTVHALIAPNILLYTGETNEEIRVITSLLMWVFMVLLLTFLPIASFICWFMAKHAVKGIKAVSSIASEIEKGKLDRRVYVSEQWEEVTQLATTFNAMLDRIRSLMSEMEEMTDNIAHDLRSPLARIRAISELVLSNDDVPKGFKVASSETIEECDRLTQMINATLDVAELEAGVFKMVEVEVNISGLVQDACEIFEAMAEQKNIIITSQLQLHCVIYGNIQYLQRMLANMLDNAIKYTQNGGLIHVELSFDKSCIEILVSDTGIGIPASEQDRIFDRFYRCDQSRGLGGCGLGLNFSRAVARSYDGNIRLLNSSDKGSKFLILLKIKHAYADNRGT